MQRCWVKRGDSYRTAEGGAGMSIADRLVKALLTCWMIFSSGRGAVRRAASARSRGALWYDPAGKIGAVLGREDSERTCRKRRARTDDLCVKLAAQGWKPECVGCDRRTALAGGGDR